MLLRLIGWMCAGCLLSAAALCPAVELEGLKGAGFEPGKLRLPLEVAERSGVARKGVVVTSGVPFPPGFLGSADRLAVVDAGGRAVACQAARMLTWHKPAYDGSVQWALVSFRADVDAGGKSTYYLVDAGRAKPPDAGLKLTKTDEALTVQTGGAKFVVPASGDALISQAWLGERQIINGKGLRGVVTSGDWPDRKLAAGGKHVGQHDRVEVEEAGPVRVVLAIKGRFAPGDADGKGYSYTARLYFAAGRASVRVVITIANDRLDATVAADGKRHVYIWPIEDASLVADLKLARPGVDTPCEGKVVNAQVAAGDLTVYQDSSGGEKWKDLGGGNYEKWLSRYTQGETVRGVSFRGYRITHDRRRLGAGNAHPGVMDVSDPGAGVAVALRNFRVEYPSALTAGPKRLRVGLFPGEFTEPFALRPGQRESWDVRLTLHGADRPDLKALHAAHDRLLLFRPAPAWMVRCANAGALATGMALLSEPARRSRRWDKGKLDGIGAGWDWHGWISGWNSGGGHWNQNPCFTPWMLWGDGDNFDAAESRTLWAADATSIHYDNPDLGALWLMLRDWPWRESRVVVSAFPGYYNRDTWGRPDSGHMAMIMWTEYYCLTGDARVRESIESLGLRARAMLWAYNHDDRGDGTGPLPHGPVNWCRKRDADAEPDFRLATRYTGWPLYDLSQWYRFTGDPQLLAEARTVARAFRNTARYSPIGFMVLQINAKGDRSVYGHQGPFEKGRAESASQCYAHFQQGIMAQGLLEYYRMSRDVEALDTLVGFADCMAHHAMMRHADGRPAGWAYTFGDYWGPYSLDDLPGKKRTMWFSSNFRIIQPLGWIYLHTGRSDYLDVLKAALESRRGLSLSTPAAHAALAHPKADRTPPGRIDDLKAEALGGGKVRLTWTAPGDDGREGQAGWYQVKYSTARIVKRVKGWPDRTPPLPTNRKEWEAKAAAFNARQRAFWAAENLPGEPRPRRAGAKETMVVANLPVGKVYLAVKTWDDAENVGQLSNVVTVKDN